jgi:hypothetical protein
LASDWRDLAKHSSRVGIAVLTVYAALPPLSKANDTATMATKTGPPERFSLTNDTISASDDAIYTHDLRAQREPFYCLCEEGYFGHLCDTSLSSTSAPTIPPSTSPIVLADASTGDGTSDQDLTWLWVLLTLALVCAAAVYARRSRTRWRAAKSAGVTSTWNTKISSFANPAFAGFGGAAPTRPSAAWVNETYAPPAEPTYDTYEVPIEGGAVGASILVAPQLDGRAAIPNPTYAVPTETGSAPVLVAAQPYDTVIADPAELMPIRNEIRRSVLNETYAVPTESGGAPVLVAAPPHCTNCMYMSADAEEAPGYVTVSPAEYAVPTENGGSPILVAAPRPSRSSMYTPADAQKARAYEIADEDGVLVTVSGSVLARDTVYVPGTDRTLYEVPFGDDDVGYLTVDADDADDQIALPNGSGVVGTAGPVAGGSVLPDVDAGPGKEMPSISMSAETML